MIQPEQRRYPRITINKEFESFGAFVDEYVADLSKIGIFVRTDRPHPVGTRIDLSFTVIVDKISVIAGIGEVIRVTQNPSGMAVRFVTINEDSQQLIATMTQG